MKTYSIYQKPCPACGAVVSVDARRCNCGHAFESSTGIDARLPEEQVLQEEELFEAYLAARIDQAVATVEAARARRSERDAQPAKMPQIRESLSSKPDAPALSAKPTEAFRAQQAAKAEKTMEGFANTRTKTCPHCQTVLPVTSALCLCGYIFARNDFLLPRAVDRFTRGEIYQAKETLIY